jgi:hypothetical protein
MINHENVVMHYVRESEPAHYEIKKSAYVGYKDPKLGHLGGLQDVQ